MSANFAVKQSKFGYRCRFVFTEDNLLYTIFDASGERQIPIPYEAINTTSPSTLLVHQTPFSHLLFRIGAVLLISPVLSMVKDELQPISAVLFSISIAMIFFALSNRWTRLIAVKITLMQTSCSGMKSSLMIIHDKNYDIVTETLVERWKLRLKTLYGRADLTADRAHEIKRLTWLRDKGVLDDQCYREEVARLAAIGTPGNSYGVPSFN